MMLSQWPNFEDKYVRSGINTFVMDCSTGVTFWAQTFTRSQSVLINLVTYQPRLCVECVQLLLPALFRVYLSPRMFQRGSVSFSSVTFRLKFSVSFQRATVVFVNVLQSNTHLSGVTGWLEIPLCALESNCKSKAINLTESSFEFPACLVSQAAVSLGQTFITSQVRVNQIH